METVSQLIAENWIMLIVVGSLLLLTVPWLIVWRYRANRRTLLANGRSAQAKILEIKASGLTMGTSSSRDGGGSMRGVTLRLEVYPDSAPPYQVKTRDQLHLLDLPRLAPGMRVAVKIDPHNPQRVALDFKSNT